MARHQVSIVDIRLARPCFHAIDAAWDAVISRKGKRTDRPVSYAEALTRAGCAETIEATV